MAEHKRKAVLGLFLLALVTVPAAGFSFRVEVAPEAEAKSSLFSYRNSTESLQRFNATVYNSGSVGCRYRLKAVFNSTNTSTKVFYSRPANLFPGGEEEITLPAVPGKENMTREGEVYIDFCGKEKKVGDFSYIQEERVQSNRTDLEVDVEEVNSTGISLGTGFSKGLVIPQDVPPHWKVSYGELEEGRTQISYDPYLFNRNRELEFIVYNRTSGRMTGSFTVDIDRKKSVVRQFLQKNLWKLIAAISLITNIFLFIKAGKSKN